MEGGRAGGRGGGHAGGRAGETDSICPRRDAHATGGSSPRRTLARPSKSSVRAMPCVPLSPSPSELTRDVGHGGVYSDSRAGAVVLADAACGIVFCTAALSLCTGPAPTTPHLLGCGRRGRGRSLRRRSIRRRRSSRRSSGGGGDVALVALEAGAEGAHGVGAAAPVARVRVAEQDRLVLRSAPRPGDARVPRVLLLLLHSRGRRASAAGR